MSDRSPELDRFKVGKNCMLNDDYPDGVVGEVIKINKLTGMIIVQWENGERRVHHKDDMMAISYLPSRETILANINERQLARKKKVRS